MTREEVTDPGKDTMNGPPEVVNISGSTPTVGATVRRYRSVQGRWLPRTAHIIGPLGPPGGIGPGGIDAVTGRFVPGIRNSAQLQDVDRVHAITAGQTQYVVPDYADGVPIERKSNDGLDSAQTALNALLDAGNRNGR